MDNITYKTAKVALLKARDFLNTYLKDPDKEAWDKFYLRFENRYRGSEKLIRERLESRYAERLRNLVKNSNLNSSETLIDLGCGRGEFLDIAKSVGFYTVGIEQSEKLGEIAKSHNHEIYCGDLIRFLFKQPDRSLLVVSMLHVIEHLNHKDIWKVFTQAARTLKPGGVLLIETPSLYSLWVSSRQFYLDPTHKTPLHPEYLKFLAEDSGFQKVELLEFCEVDEPGRAKLAASSTKSMKQEFETLEKWLYGPMDMALWAVK